jgi:hypothetical protein
MNATESLTATLRKLDIGAPGIQHPTGRRYAVTTNPTGEYVVTDGWNFGVVLGRTVAEARDTLRRIADR